MIIPKITTILALAGGIMIGMAPGPAIAQTNTEMRLVFDIPMNHPRVPYFLKMASAIEHKSSGGLTLAINPGGKIYPGFASIEALRKGEADLTFVNAANLEKVDPRFGFINLPFTINDTMMAKPNARAAIVDLLDGLAKPHGLRVIGLIRGADQLFIFRKKTVAGIGDLKGMKIRIAGPGIYQEIMHRLAVDATVLPIPELKPAFERGTLEGVFTSPGAWASQIGMTAPNATRIPGLMMITYVMVAREEVMERLSAGHRSILIDAARRHVTDGWNMMLADDEAILKDMIAKGAKLTLISDTGPWRSAVAPIIAHFEASQAPTATQVRSALEAASR